MKSFSKYFLTSSIITVIALIICFIIGGWKAVIVGATLAILEISLSFDNAVVNASVLNGMDEKWRKRFLTIGIIIAVFGARLIIPILIVSITSALDPLSVFRAAFFDTEAYALLIENIHIYVSGFGSAFLGMVFLKFFFDENKTNHWIPWVEKHMQKIGVIESVQSLIMLIVAVLFSGLLVSDAKIEYLVSAIWGIVIYLIIDGITSLISPQDTPIDTANTADTANASVTPSKRSTTSSAITSVARSGLVGFLYLELLDMSFSLDGVIGAFAITQDIVIILIGLTVGSFFVRSFTIYMVDKKALKQFIYLEHGAFWSVGILAACMLLKTIYHIPELLIVGITVAVLIVSVWHSYVISKKEAQV